MTNVKMHYRTDENGNYIPYIPEAKKEAKKDAGGLKLATIVEGVIVFVLAFAALFFASI